MAREEGFARCVGSIRRAQMLTMHGRIHDYPLAGAQMQLAVFADHDRRDQSPHALIATATMRKDHRLRAVAVHVDIVFDYASQGILRFSLFPNFDCPTAVGCLNTTPSTSNPDLPVQGNPIVMQGVAGVGQLAVAP